MNEKNQISSRAIVLSLAVVTYNRNDLVFDKFLEALYSVVFASVRPDEIIVINNDHADFETILKSKINCAREGWLDKAENESAISINLPDIVVKTSPQKNLAVARNLALEIARSPLLAMIDDDQKVESGWLAEMAVSYTHLTLPTKA